ncbi:hypothetical protein BVRB_4g080270 [Beta vulgaris subsp. vulgaris]|nr:hypothetical protein BVRB_4g080270 [Beta vulgaris subsp. vulgaris]
MTISCCGLWMLKFRFHISNLSYTEGARRDSSGCQAKN